MSNTNDPKNPKKPDPNDPDADKKGDEGRGPMSGSSYDFDMMGELKSYGDLPPIPQPDAAQHRRRLPAERAVAVQRDHGYAHDQRLAGRRVGAGRERVEHHIDTAIKPQVAAISQPAHRHIEPFQAHRVNAARRQLRCQPVARRPGQPAPEQAQP